MATAQQQLQNVVQAEINRGARVEYQTQDQVTLSTGKPVNHILHLIVSVILAPWSVVWAIFEFTGGVKREQIRVDDAGNVNRQTIEGGNPLWAKIVSVVIVVVWLALISQAF